MRRRIGLLLLGLGLLGLSFQLKKEEASAPQRVPSRTLPSEDTAHLSQDLPSDSQGMSLANLRLIDEDSSSDLVYEEFSQLKGKVQAEPAFKRSLIEEIRSQPEDSSASRRRLTVLFGALAQSGDVDTTDDLLELAEDCSTEFCRIQALMALHSQEKPQPKALDRLLKLVDQTEDKVEIHNTALLAAGTLAERLGPEGDALPAYLATKWSQNPPLDESLILLRTMGNHGHPAYLPILKQSLREQNPLLRATAISSLRSQTSENFEVPELILSQLQKEKDPQVIEQGLQAIASQKMERRHVQALTVLALEWPLEDLQMKLARILVIAYETEPEKVRSSLEFLAHKTSSQQVSRYLASVL